MLKAAVKKGLSLIGISNKEIYQTKMFLSGVYFTYFMKTYKSEGLEYYVPSELTDFKFRGRFAQDDYENEVKLYLKKYLPKEASVLELGACIGVVSCFTNKLLSNPNNHVVVEANPRLIEPLVKNKEHNSCGFKIDNCIVSNLSEVEFYIHDLIVGGSAKRKTAHKIKVKGKNIEDLEKQHGVDFDTLIMDIEGAELVFFRENKEYLKDIKLIFLEIHPFAGIMTIEEVEECNDILKGLSFSLLVEDSNFQVWHRK